MSIENTYHQIGTSVTSVIDAAMAEMFHALRRFFVKAENKSVVGTIALLIWKFPQYFAILHNLPHLQSSAGKARLNSQYRQDKEKLFAYLSRFCAVPYCIICHSCALRPLGMTAAEVLALLSEPWPETEVEISKHRDALAAQSSPLEEWPAPGSALDESLMACSVFSFLNPRQAEDCRAQLRRLLGKVECDYLMMLLGYVKMCHLWVEAHPELSYEADKRVQENL